MWATKFHTRTRQTIFIFIHYLEIGSGLRFKKKKRRCTGNLIGQLCAPADICGVWDQSLVFRVAYRPFLHIINCFHHMFLKTLCSAVSTKGKTSLNLHTLEFIVLFYSGVAEKSVPLWYNFDLVANCHPIFKKKKSNVPVFKGESIKKWHCCCRRRELLCRNVGEELHINLASYPRGVSVSILTHSLPGI